MLTTQAGTTAQALPDSPNVVVIMTDDQTLEQLRVMTSTLDLLGTAGTTFTSFYATFPLCCPSRATYLTGQYAFNHGVLSNKPPAGGYQALDSTNTLPVWLQGAGYRTIHIGKYLNGYPSPTSTSIPPGWTDWQGLTATDYYDWRINDNGTIVSYGTAPEDYQTDVLADRAETAIAESAPGGPFFLNLSIHAPHTDSGFPPVPAPRHVGAFADEPLPQPPSFNEADVSDKPREVRTKPLLTDAAIAPLTEKYRAELESLLAADEFVERVISALDASGELANTVVMFTSDNGQFHGEHRIEGGKSRFFEEATRVPLLVRGPGFPAGMAVDTVAANIDLAPTISAIAGATPGLAVDGLDVRSLIANPAAYAGRYIGLERHDKSCFTGVHSASEVYVRYATGEEQLYDLASDPYQLQSLHADPTAAQFLADMRAAHDALIPDVLPPCGSSTPLTVGVGDVTVAEPSMGRNAAINVPVTLGRRSRSTLTFSYQLTAGTADSTDATFTTGSVTFAPLTTTNSVRVSVRADAVAEATEEFYLEITAAPEGVGLLRPTGIVTILDRGAPAQPNIAVGDVAVVEGNSGGAGKDSISVPVTLSHNATAPVTISFGTADSTALGGFDYTAASGSITIPQGATTALIRIVLRADEYDEPDEQFTVTMSAVPGYESIRPTGTVFILDDDDE